MSSVEIEDVLSSIRRLVSEDLRPGLRQVPAAPAPVADDKLILTPAFRVAPPAPTPLPRLHLGAEPVARKVASTLERTVGAHSTEWESEVGDPPLIARDVEWTEDGWAMPTAEIVTLKPADPLPSWAQVEPEPEIAAAEPTPITEPDRGWADRAEAEVVAELNATAAPEGVIDEQVLRDLVRELILEALQGDLGERITRNVRKLVRAEIARAIATRDIE